MIKCNIKRGGKAKISANGPAKDLFSETMLLVQEVYRGIKKTNPEAADAYRDAIILTAMAPNSPVWEEEPIDTMDSPNKAEP